MKHKIIIMALVAASALLAPRAAADSFSIAFGFSGSDWHNYGSRSIYSSYCDPVYVTPVYHTYDTYCAPACGIVHAHYFAPCYPVYYSYYPTYRSTLVYDSYYAWPSYTPFYSFGGYFSYRSGNYWYNDWNRPYYRGGHWGGYHYRNRWNSRDRHDHWGRWDRDRWDRNRWDRNDWNRGGRGDWDRNRDGRGDWDRNDRNDWNRDRGGSDRNRDGGDRDRDNRGGDWNRNSSDRGGSSDRGTWNRQNLGDRGGDSAFRQEGRGGREISGDSRSPFASRDRTGGQTNFGNRGQSAQFDSRNNAFQRGNDRVQARELPSREAISKGVTENFNRGERSSRSPSGIDVDSSRMQRGGNSIDSRGGFESRGRGFDSNGAMRSLPQARGGAFDRGSAGRGGETFGRSSVGRGESSAGRSFGGASRSGMTAGGGGSRGGGGGFAGRSGGGGGGRGR